MFKVELKGLDRLKSRFDDLNKDIKKATRLAVNETARKVANEANAAIAQAFDRPVPRTAKAVKVFQYARYDNDLTAIVGVDDGGGKNRLSVKGFKNTVYPAKYLSAQIMGGTRAPKRYELALQQKGLMPKGMFAVFAKRSESLDQYGNLPAAKIVQILQWFGAFPEVGYRTNMNARSKSNMSEAKGRYKKLKWGFAYFRGGPGTGLPDGIWERHYPNGREGKSFIRPVLIYVRGSNYRSRFKFYEVADRVVKKTLRDEFGKQFEKLRKGAK